MTKAKRVWLCRNNGTKCGIDGDYKVYVGTRPVRTRHFGKEENGCGCLCWLGYTISLCARNLHDAGITLKEGAGPVELKVSIVKPKRKVKQ